MKHDARLLGLVRIKIDNKEIIIKSLQSLKELSEKSKDERLKLIYIRIKTISQFLPKNPADNIDKHHKRTIARLKNVECNILRHVGIILTCSKVLKEIPKKNYIYIINQLLSIVHLIIRHMGQNTSKHLKNVFPRAAARLKTEKTHKENRKMHAIQWGCKIYKFYLSEKRGSSAREHKTIVSLTYKRFKDIYEKMSEEEINSLDVNPGRTSKTLRHYLEEYARKRQNKKNKKILRPLFEDFEFKDEISEARQDTSRNLYA